jgi:hypothetical protein
MNYSDRYLRQIASYSTIDVMLADVAVRIQLSPTEYQLAVDHYHAINEWLERDGSALKGFVRDFYAQGGFAIGATVARHSSDDEFDIDVMADIAYRIDVDPEDALSTLHDAIRGECGSRYYLKADRKTRCSTVNYDGMHLDVTPTVRIAGTVEKTGLIFHSKPEEPWAKKSLFANPHGFAQWFISRTPPDQDFGTFFERRSLDYDRERALILKRADAVSVPEHCPAYQKSRTVIALQLISAGATSPTTSGTQAGGCPRRFFWRSTSPATPTTRRRSRMNSASKSRASSPSSSPRKIRAKRSLPVTRCARTTSSRIAGPRT